MLTWENRKNKICINPKCHYRSTSYCETCDNWRCLVCDGFHNIEIKKHTGVQTRLE